MYHTLRTNAEHPHFTELVRKLDAELADRDGAEHSFYAPFNTIQLLQHCVVVFDGEMPVGCGALKPFDTTAMEVKRMYTLPNYRGKGVATKVLQTLEQWAAELGYAYCILETGKRQPEAIALYKKNGYQIIENYGQYMGVENSVCFRKSLNTHLPALERLNKLSIAALANNENVNPTIVFAGNVVEVGLVKSMLEDAGIHAFLKDEIVGMLSPWFTAPGGAGSIKVLVSKADETAAKAVVAAYEKNINAAE